MKQARALSKWVSSWDVAAWSSAAICAAAFAIMMFGNSTGAVNQAGPPPVPLGETAVWLLLLPLCIVILLPFLAAPQFITFWLVRRTGNNLARILLLLVSAVMLVPYYRYVATADLVSTSTAALGAAFYPIYLAALAAPVSVVIFGISRFAERRKARSR